MTDDDFLAWLERGGMRTALVEVGTAVPRYLSTTPYTTMPDDTPANVAHLPVVAPGFAFSERLSLSGTPSISVGAIEIYNEDGSLDDWLDDIWVNRTVRVYIGDVDWPRSDFRLVFDGLAASLAVSSAGRLSIVLRNKLERLNTPVTDTLLGGTTPNKDQLRPITLGECHNVTPLLIDPPTHEYQWHYGAAERLIEVRDNGVPVGTTTTLSSGTFKLTASPAGQITASVQGATPYAPNISALVQVLATQYGTPSERLTSGDLDAANLSQFAADCPQAVGVSLTQRANVLQTCQQLASSVGAQVVMSRQGKLRLVRIALPGTGTPIEITPKDYEYGSFSVRERTEVIAGVKLGYCRNWTPQGELETGIPAEHRSMYAQEWLTVSSRDAAVAATYRLYGDAQQEDTLLLRGADAQAEADRRLALWKVQRTVFRFSGYAHLLMLDIGRAVTLTAPRFGLDAGKSGVVIGLESDWVAGRVSVEVLV